MVWLRLPNHTIQRGKEKSRLLVPEMTRQQIERGVSMRKYAWGNPTQAIADGAGVPLKVINQVLKRETVSDEAYMLLTSYLRTPAGPHALVKSRETGSPGRVAQGRRVRKLMRMAISRGLRTKSGASIASMTMAELRCYGHMLEWRLKQHILEHEELAPYYLMPDELEAWEWLERFDKIRQHLKTSGSSPRLSTSGTANPPTDQTWRSLWESLREKSSGSAGAALRPSGTTAATAASTGSGMSSPRR